MNKEIPEKLKDKIAKISEKYFWEPTNKAIPALKSEIKNILIESLYYSNEWRFFLDECDIIIETEDTHIFINFREKNEV